RMLLPELGQSSRPLVRTPSQQHSFTERVDAWALHPVAGLVLFVAVMGMLFQALFSWSEPAINAIESLFSWTGEQVAALLPAGLVAELVVDGLIGGVGSVVVFLPQILLLFFLLGLLEDSGYMARVAYLVDRAMRALGLHGRAFVPMLSGYACAVPAVMATRTLESRRDRLLTMMVVPLMSCSARLPVYTLIIASLFPTGKLLGFFPVQSALMVGMYLFSPGAALLAAGVLGRTVLKGKRIPLLMELPPYRLPRLRTVLWQMWMRARSFLTEAGTVILACTVVLWALLSFPRDVQLSRDYEAERVTMVAQGASEELLAAAEAEERGERLQHSYAGRMGKMIEPLIAPLGFDWKIGIGLVGAFAAREVFVSTMGLVYGIGDDVSEESEPLREKMAAERHRDGSVVYTPLTGLSL
ncbi:MAG TPA: ferrous iron transport protein B, partial [Myxococcota bacterium]|nr:ferrous iron transport protein B [Myxococcota bacterium]